MYLDGFLLCGRVGRKIVVVSAVDGIGAIRIPGRPVRVVPAMKGIEHQRADQRIGRRARTETQAVLPNHLLAVDVHTYIAIASLGRTVQPQLIDN
jgi:hypothetical protein